MNQNQIFKDLKVLELANILAGPSVGMFFAELGAAVTKIENPKTNGDPTRQWKLESEKDKPISAYYASVNWGKKVKFIDFETENGLLEIYELVKSSDIIIVNFKKGDDLKFKLDYETLKKIKPKLIYAHLDGFGVFDDKPAFDVVLQAESGFMSMNGNSANETLKMPVALIDVVAAHQLKEAILIALINVYKTGKGAMVKTSLFESALSSLVNQASNYLMERKIAKPQGSLHPNIAPYGETFVTADNKKIVLAIGTEKQFEKLCKTLELSDLLTNEKFSNNTQRVKNRTELEKILHQKIEKIELINLARKFEAEKIPFGEIKNIAEVLNQKNIESLILEEMQENCMTKRIKSISFQIYFS